MKILLKKQKFFIKNEIFDKKMSFVYLKNEIFFKNCILTKK